MINNVPIKITDLVLGPGSLPLDKTNGEATSSGEAKQTLFDGVFSNLLKGNKQQLNLLNKTGEPISIPNNGLGNLFSLISDNINEKVNPAQLLGNFPVDNKATTTDDKKTININDYTGIPSNSLLPELQGVFNKNVLQVINVSPMELLPGMYDVKNVTISDGALHLEVVNPNAPNQKVELTVSLALLQKMSNFKNLDGAFSKRVELNGFGNNKMGIENFISKLNIKKIEITNGENSKSNNSQIEPVNIDFIGENKGTEIHLKAKLSRSEIKATIVNKVGDELSDENLPSNSLRQGNETGLLRQTKENHLHHMNKEKGPNDASLKEPYFFAGSDKLAMKRNKLLGSKLLFDNMSLADDGESLKIISSNDNNWGSFDNFFNFTSSGQVNETSLKQGQAPPIRFILPENLKTLLKPNGQSVILKIAPEHLGPAKLSISMHKDELRAHLTVSSHEAKATLESSLHRLVDQLAKADIKVDFIDVTVSDHNAGNEFLNRQSYGQKSNSIHRFNYDDDNIEKSTPMVQQPQRKVENYITTDRVNLLA